MEIALCSIGVDEVLQLVLDAFELARDHLSQDSLVTVMGPGLGPELSRARSDSHKGGNGSDHQEHHQFDQHCNAKCRQRKLLESGEIWRDFAASFRDFDAQRSRQITSISALSRANFDMQCWRKI